MTLRRMTFAAMAVVASALAWAGGGSGFTPGNLVVTRLGTGAAALNNSATPVVLAEYDLFGNLVQTVAINGVGSSPRLTVSGTATSEGFLTLGGGFLWLIGYDAEVGTQGGVAVGGSGTGTAINNSSPDFVPRAVGRVSLDGTVDLSTLLSDAFSQSSARSATSADGSNFWAAGTGGTGQGATAGIRSGSVGTNTSTQVSASATNLRVVNVYNGQLYVSSQTGSFIGVSTVGTGLPTTSGEELTLLPGMPDTSGTGNASTYDFVFTDDDTLYTCDDRSVANGGGLVKWTRMGGVWSVAYKLTQGLGTVGVRSVCIAGGTSSAPLLAVITGEATATRLMVITDSGTGLDSFTLVASAPTNMSFRGVECIPASSQRLLSGNVGLQNWDGDISGPSVTFEIYDGVTLIDTETMNLDSVGNYSFVTTAAPGTYDVYAKASQWLRRKVGNVMISASGASGVNFSLINGDLDDDNEVSIGDYAIMSGNFGNPGPIGDVNGDGEVDIADFAIISLNFGLTGD